MLESLKPREYLYNKANISRKERQADISRRERQAGISRRERLKCMAEGIGIVLAIAMFFYRTLWAIPFLFPLYILYQRERTKSISSKKQKEMAVQFKEAILSVSANQKAGYSVENSFRQAYEDMILLYGRDSPICKEFAAILTGLNNNLILEKLLHDFGRRSKVEDIREFAEVFAAAKRNGGNMTEVIERSASVIEDKVETEKEIRILISAKQLEQKIMNLVPFGILLYIGATSRGFFDVLYHNLPGILIMTVCLAVYTAAVLLSVKIVNIEV